MDRIKNIKFTRKLVIKLILLSPVIAILVYAALIRPVQVRLEQREFRAAETYLEEKKNEIEKLVGPADKVEKTNSCGYSSAKFSKGSLGCSASLQFTYGADSLEQANQYLDKIEPIGLHAVDRFGEQPARFTKFDDEKSSALGQTLKMSEQEQSAMEWLQGYRRPGCNIYYRYYGDNLHISMSCGGQAMTEMYPVVER